jgi:hypothetical protein
MVKDISWKWLQPICVGPLKHSGYYTRYLPYCLEALYFLIEYAYVFASVLRIKNDYIPKQY